VKPTERLLDLIILFLNSRRAIPFDELRESFDGEYEGEAGRRKFERDKDELKALGIPLRYLEADPDDDDEGGYVVDRERMYLPELSLEPDEMAVVYLAGLSLLDRTAFPYRDALATALRKIELRTDAAAPAVERVVIDAGERDVDASDESLRELERAITARKRVRFTYRAQYNAATAAREVEPYGLFRRRGRWSLVGFARERKAVRVFLVHRMSDVEVNATKPGSPDFAPPADFRLGEWAHLPAWRYEVALPVVITLEVRADLAWMAERHFRMATRGDGEWRALEVETTNPDAVVQWALGLGPAARLIAPNELRARMKTQLEAVANGSG
jgi:predicted DNA-binding transcriptional regulator YafY